MTLSILIATVEERKELFEKLLAWVYVQKMELGTDDVEILWETDNRELTSGAKRNKLLNRARGKYIIFVDDDDWVPGYYIEELLKAARSDADCFAINGIITTDGENEVKWYLSKDNLNNTVFDDGTPYYVRTTNHITGVRRKIALQVGFPDKSNAEDKAYSDALKPLLKTEYTINPPMYHYRFSSHNKLYK